VQLQINLHAVIQQSITLDTMVASRRANLAYSHTSISSRTIF